MNKQVMTAERLEELRKKIEAEKTPIATINGGMHRLDLTMEEYNYIRSSFDLIKRQREALERVGRYVLQSKGEPELHHDSELVASEVWSRISGLVEVPVSAAPDQQGKDRG